jgi:hypothetical protein
LLINSAAIVRIANLSMVYIKTRAHLLVKRKSFESIVEEVMCRGLKLLNSFVNQYSHGRQLGFVINSGRTRRSNSLPVTKPSLIASARSVVPFALAAFAIFAALS